MAIFLLLYVLLMLVWLSWSGMITYILLKYRYPDNIGLARLAVYWIVSVTMIVISLVFIAGADWVTVPDFFKTIGI